MRLYLSLVCALAILGVAFANPSGDATLEIWFDDPGTIRPFRYLTAVDRWVANDIAADPARNLRPFVTDARRALAEELGYAGAPGEEAWLIPRTGPMRYRLMDVRTGQVLSQTRAAGP